MPDVQVKLDGNLFAGDQYELLFLEALAVIVAEQMSCDDNGGDYLRLDPETQIDPYSTHYDVTTDRVRQIVIIDLSAFDYDERMGDVDERIANIANAAKALLPENISVQVTFHPVAEKCWVAVA